MTDISYKKGLFLLILIIFSVGIVLAKQSEDKIWREIDESDLRNLSGQKFTDPKIYKTFRLNKTSLQKTLDQTPNELMTIGEESEVILTLPMPDGSFHKFAIKESPIMENALAAKFPEIKTYMGQGIDDPTASTRFDMTPNGFRAMILSKDGTIYIEPYSKGDTSNYVSFNKSSLEKKVPFTCSYKNDKPKFWENSSQKPQLPKYDNIVTNGTMLKTYRLAMAVTGEYTQFHGGTVNSAMAAITTTVNRVNGIYERELSIRLNLIANNDTIVYTDGNTDPYTNQNTGTMLDENQTNLDNTIGTANYDIGHVMGTGDGGVVGGFVCAEGEKALGVTGQTEPQGDSFDVDYVAHEIGHQFTGNHAFNGNAGSCGGGNRVSTTAFEPGSGSTIISYAGICDPQNLQSNSHDYFHVITLEEIVTFITNATTGGSCSVDTATGNTPPTIGVSGGTTFNIPQNTPFALTATGSDANGDALVYNWEEYDLGQAGLPAANVNAPVFRSYPATTSPMRTFPSLPYILNNANTPPATYQGTSPTGAVCADGITCLTGEVLPTISRSMNFQVTARDNRAGGGGINSTTATVNVDAGSGPFLVTTPNTNVSWTGNSQQTITWSVNNTNAAPVNTANVRILLSTDGGQTFPTVISANTANDGTETITVPNTATTNGRIKVEAVGNIFFDISDVNFTITAGPNNNTKRFFDFDGDNRTDVSIFRPNVGEWWYLRSSDNGNRALQFGSQTDVLAPADFTGDGKTDIAFFRPAIGEWFVLRSEDNSFFSFPFGANGDIPAPADYDGDNRADPAVFRPSTSTWFILKSTGGTDIIGFGIAEDKPVVADYDGDGRDDIAIYRPSVSEWWINGSQAGVTAVQFGSTGDRTVQGDYTGDGKADVSFFKPTTGEWFILRSEDNSFFSFPFGTNGDIPAPGDYDGDGRFDATVFRPSNNTWFINGTTSGVQIFGFGANGDIPVPSAYSVQ